MVIEVFVAQRQTIQALPYQAGQIVQTTGTTARISDRMRYRLAQSEPAIGLLQQQYAAVTGDIATGESSFDPAAFTGWKVKRVLGTFCHGQSPVRVQRKQLNFIELHGLCPFYW